MKLSTRAKSRKRSYIPPQHRATIKAVRTDYLGGRLTLPEIAAKHEVSETTVTSWRRTYGWPPRRPATASIGKRGMWRCDCGQLNNSTPCRCGITPQWAKKEDAA